MWMGSFCSHDEAIRLFGMCLCLNPFITVNKERSSLRASREELSRLVRRTSRIDLDHDYKEVGKFFNRKLIEPYKCLQFLIKAGEIQQWSLSSSTECSHAKPNPTWRNRECWVCFKHQAWNLSAPVGQFSESVEVKKQKGHKNKIHWSVS